ncbi:hypothetical protein NV379_02260 [Paenibacillus sp. N1-5-1-14]|uniref:hypothetical protein n=1 Tax=Paenibacillus radicibacter TaxID=2972488 RepID=UPI002159AC37|nr:hypothetical protein [Paenibacillus radicibacter]MCR8641470.1 hypothetical protein [Paenibacillus radicibacter]
MKLELKDYLANYRPEIIEEYQRYVGDIPSAGDKVVSLVSGYGGSAGVTRIVFEVNDRDIVLQNPSDPERRFLCSKVNWWREVKLV